MWHGCFYSNRNGDKTESAKAMSQYINNEPDCIDMIIKAFKKVKKLCDPHKELSTILEYFISIIEDIILKAHSKDILEKSYYKDYL